MAGMEPPYKPFTDDYYLPGPNGAVDRTMPGRVFKLGDSRNAILAGSTTLEFDAELSRYQHAKASERAPGPLSSLSKAEESGVKEWLCKRIQDPHSKLIERANTLDDVVSLIQEDVVVMRKAAAEKPSDAIAAYVNVAFPSGWCPQCIAGSNFEQIHRFVPENGKFTNEKRPRHSGHLWTTPVVRFVWTVVPDGRLNRHRCHKDHIFVPQRDWNSATEVFLRVERQVASRLSNCLGIFLIRIYVHPVHSMRERDRQELRHAIEQVCRNDAVASYKGFKNNLERIYELFDAAG